MTPDNVVGLVGLTIFSLLFVHCAIQVCLFLWAKEYEGRIYEKIKLRFHIVFSINALLECVYALSQYLNDEFSRWAYICHLMGLYMNLVWFVVVIFMWNHVLASQNLIQVKTNLYIIFLSINGVSTAVEVALFAYYGDRDEYTVVQRIDGFTANIFYVVSLFLATLMLLIVFRNMKAKLKPNDSGLTNRSSGNSSRNSGSTNNKNNGQRSVRKLLRKINLCLVIFLSSYSLRIYFIGRLTVTWMMTGEEPTFSQYSNFVWVLMTYWIPTLAPGVMFLAIMRFRRHSSGDNMTESLTSSGPTSDQVYNYDLEDNFTTAPSDDREGYRREELIEEGQEAGRKKRELADAVNTSVEHQDAELYVDRLTFYSKDGNDLKMSVF